MKVFIDGSSGTTGLVINERLNKREDITLIKLNECERKDSGARRQAIYEADAAFLCLPDAAAIEAETLAGDCNTVILDTSTAHRTASGWAYGFPELSKDFYDGVRSSKRIAVPGCHASGFIALVYPLIEAGIISEDSLLSCFSLTGYSGGGKKMIAEYEADEKSETLFSPRHYGLTQSHKHLKEMKAVTGLSNEPVFCPVVDDYYRGMLVTVPLFSSQLASGKCVDDVKKCYEKKYSGDIVSYFESLDENGFISANGLCGTDKMKITVCGNSQRMVLTALYDNLGKGASGAAVECLNIVSGMDASYGLNM